MSRGFAEAVVTRNPDDYIEVPPDALVRTSGQLWKLIVGTIAIPLPTLFLGLGFLGRIGPDQPRSEVVGSIGILFLAAASVGTLLSSVRCPSCRDPWVRRVMKEPDGLRAVSRFLRMRACPLCNHGASAGENPSA